MSLAEARRTRGSCEAKGCVAKVPDCADPAGCPGVAARADRVEPDHDTLRFATATHRRRTAMTQAAEIFEGTGVPTLNRREAM